MSRKLPDMRTERTGHQLVALSNGGVLALMGDARGTGLTEVLA